VKAALVVSGRSESPPWNLFELEPVEERVEREVEVEAVCSPSVMTSTPARTWSAIAAVTASRIASSRSSGPTSSACPASNSSQPGNG
jgi:hypothetical protein